jgi:two-component system LytT family response regulator
MKVKAIVVDDEDKARKSLISLIQIVDNSIDVIAEASNIETAYTAILNHDPDLVFLDIEMPSGTAFDLLNKFEKIDFDIVFVTAFDDYAIKAFKFSAFDYLLKPVDLDELTSTISKYKSSQNVDNHPRFDMLLQMINKNSQSKLAIPEADGISVVDIDDIIRCTSSGNYTTIHLINNQEILSSKTLGEYDDILIAHDFFRIHRSHLINMKFIHKYIKSDGGYILMKDKSELEISRRKKVDFIDKLTNFKG